MISKDSIIGIEKDGSPVTLGELQLNLKDMLKDIVSIFDKQNIYYFATEGTLLGAIRHSDIIPWDDDIDLGFRLEDYRKVLNALVTNLDARYEVQCFDTNNNYAVTQPIIKVRLKNTYVEYDAWYDKNNCECSGIFIDLIAFSGCCPTNKDFFNRKISLLRTIVLLFCNFLNINFILLKKLHLNNAYQYAKKYKGSNKVGYALNFIPWKKYIFDKKDFESLMNVKFDNFYIKVPVGYDNILKNMYGNYRTIPSINNIKLLHSKNIRLKDGTK